MRCCCCRFFKRVNHWLYSSAQNDLLLSIQKAPSTIDAALLRRLPAKTHLTLKQGKVYDQKQEKFINVTGQYQYVVYQEENAYKINIDQGSHYVVARGRKKVIIAGDVNLQEGNIVEFSDQSGTYHHSPAGDSETRAKVYQQQELALKNLQIPSKCITRLMRVVPQSSMTSK